MDISIKTIIERSIERVIDEIEYQSRKYHTKFFEFIDECIAPKRLMDIAKEIIKRGLEVYWSAESRIEKAFMKEELNKLYQAGCRILYMGLESASQKILDKMKK